MSIKSIWRNLPADKAHKLSFPFLSLPFLAFPLASVKICSDKCKIMICNPIYAPGHRRSFGRSTGSCTFITLWWTPRVRLAQLLLLQPCQVSICRALTRVESSATGIQSEGGRKGVCVRMYPVYVSVSVCVCVFILCVPRGKCFHATFDSTRFTGEWVNYSPPQRCRYLSHMRRVGPGWDHAECVYCNNAGVLLQHLAKNMTYFMAHSWLISAFFVPPRKFA